MGSDRPYMYEALIYENKADSAFAGIAYARLGRSESLFPLHAEFMC